MSSLLHALDKFPVVNLPAEIRDKLTIGDSPVYFFESVLKVKANGHVHDKILAITDRALFVCSARGSIKRIIPVSSIGQILRKAPNYLGFRIPSELDLLLLFKAPDDAERISQILTASSRVLSGSAPVDLVDVRPSTVLTLELNLGGGGGGYGSASPNHQPASNSYSPTRHPAPAAAIGAPPSYHDPSTADPDRRAPPTSRHELDGALASLRNEAAREAARDSPHHHSGYRGPHPSTLAHYSGGAGDDHAAYGRGHRDVEIAALGGDYGAAPHAGYGGYNPASAGATRAPPPAPAPPEKNDDIAVLSQKVDMIAEALARLHGLGGAAPAQQQPQPATAGAVGHPAAIAGVPAGAVAPAARSSALAPTLSGGLSSLPQMLFDEDELILKYEPEVDFDSHPLTHDPRTGLALIDVPPDFLPLFQDMQSCVMHFFGGCNIISETGAREPAVIVVTDEFVYAVVVEVDPTGGDDGGAPLQRKWLRRCFAVSQIDNVMFTERGYVGFVVPSDFDLLLLTSSSEQMYDLLRVVTVINRYRSTGSSRPALVPMRYETESFLPPNGKGLNLVTPPQYEVQVGPLHMRKGLEECVAARARLLNLERRRVNQTALQTLNTRVAAVQAAMAQDLYVLVSQDLDHLHRHLQDAVAERDTLRSQVAAYEAELRHLRGPSCPSSPLARAPFVTTWCAARGPHSSY